MLSIKHMKNRESFAKKHVKNKWKNWLFGDFKWFNCHRGVKKSYYRKGSPRKFVHVQNKRFLPKIMFFSVVSKSVPDGKIGLFIAGEKVAFNRGPRKGQLHWVPHEVDHEYYKTMLKKKVFPAIRRKLGHVPKLRFNRTTLRPKT
jgi:hypothetical protein